MESNRKVYFHMDASDVAYINQIFESYEGVGLLRTIDKSNTQMCLYTNAWMVEKCLSLLESLKTEGLNIFSVRVEVSSLVE